jgi:hypothetical protein
MGAVRARKNIQMPTHAQSSGVSETGWGIYHPAEAVRSVGQLKAGDVVLQRALKPGFPQPCLHVLEVIGGDPTGENRPLVRARLLDPARRTQRVSSGIASVVLWDFCLIEGRAQLFRAADG